MTLKQNLIQIVSKNIKAERLRLGMSQEKLSSLTGYSVRYISRLETEPQNMRLDQLQTFAQALGVSPLSLIATVDCNSLLPDMTEQLGSAIRSLQSIYTRCAAHGV